ncbi:Gfo/Idh/MocA family protein [Natrialbaceae archaeon A-CW1-1]
MTADRSTVKTGIVGCGNIGQHHAERLSQLGVPIVGGMDVSEAARRRFAERYDAESYADHHELYDAVDAVVITTPNAFHEEYAVDAFERNRHVLLEKTLAHTLESAERIAAAAAKSHGVSMVGFNNRFRNGVRLIADRIARGELGEVMHVEANYVRRRGVPGRGSWFTSKNVAGGGSLIDIGVHVIDLSMYLLEYPTVETVSGVTRSEFGGREEYAYLEMWGEDAGPDGFDVDDSASAFIRCDGNRTISLEVAWATNRPPTYEIVVRGTEAAAVFDLHDHEVTIHSARSTGTDHFVDTTLSPGENDGHVDEQRAFFDAIESGNEIGVGASVEDALTVQRIVDGIYRSSERGEAVELRSSGRAEPVGLDSGERG